MAEKKPFFETLPGILTGLAGLITAVVALIYALTEAGLIGADKAETTPNALAERPAQVAPAAQQTNAAATANQAATSNAAATSAPKSEQTTDGWAIIGFYRQGTFSDLKLMVHGDSPAIGSSYDVTDDFRLIHKPRAAGEAVITLGMVHRGDSVEILDLVIKPGRERVPVHAKLRAVVHKQ